MLHPWTLWRLKTLSKIYSVRYYPKKNTYMSHIKCYPTIIFNKRNHANLKLVSQSWVPIYYRSQSLMLIYPVIYDNSSFLHDIFPNLICQFSAYVTFIFPSARTSSLNHVLECFFIYNLYN